MKRLAIIAALIAVFAGGFYWRARSQRKPPEEAFAGERRVTLWSSTAQVREPLAALSYGERVDVLLRQGEDAEVRTPQGLIGWVDARQLLSAELWHRVTNIIAQARVMPVQASGHTKVLSNLRIEPGRDTQRIVQLGRGSSVEVLAREGLDAPPPSNASNEESQQSDEPKREDWLLVRAKTEEMGELAGWVLGRFIEFDLPSPLPDYTSAAAMHVVAWFVLNQVPDKDGSPRPQYLVVGTRGSEGQACDFTLMRVYTWGLARQRYETAFVQSDLCGKLPVRVNPAAQLAGDASFQFAELGDKGATNAEYRMHQTVVRRLRQAEAGQKARR